MANGNTQQSLMLTDPKQSCSVWYENERKYTFDNNNWKVHSFLQFRNRKRDSF